MKLRIEVDGESYTLNFERNETEVEYSFEGAESQKGEASIAEVGCGAYSVLLNNRSFAVYVSEKDGLLEVWTAGQRHLLAVADARDRAAGGKKVAAAGRVEIRAQMPGKIIKLLVSAGAPVEAGQGVIVVEAMKMQNEMKSPKGGVVSHIRVQEGSTVAAGETLMVVE